MSPKGKSKEDKKIIIVAKGWEEALMNTGFILGGREGASKKCSKIRVVMLTQL